MPLTPFQKAIARLLAAHRNPDSHLAGGAVINRPEDSFRFSEDFDIFHDAAINVAVAADADAQTLQDAGYHLHWLLRQEGFRRAEVSLGTDRVRLDWTTDSAFRFFPVQPDEDFGYCLHPADLAVNKVLALAGRTEIRDLLDIVFLDETYLSFGAMVWAACGKDPGYTPALLMDMTNRHSRFQSSDLKGEHLAHPVDFRDLKMRWLAARERAEHLVSALPEQELGCLYLDTDNRPVTPDPRDPTFGNLRRHFGSVRGAWPKIEGSLS